MYARLALWAWRSSLGPPFSAKGQNSRVAAVRQPGDVVLDTTPIWKTFASPEPGDVRTVEDAAIANSMKRKGLERAVETSRDGYVILAARDPATLGKWLACGGAGESAARDRASQYTHCARTIAWSRV